MLKCLLVDASLYSQYLILCGCKEKELLEHPLTRFLNYFFFCIFKTFTLRLFFSFIKWDDFSFLKTGFLKSLHRQKNGTPRQGAVSSLSRAKLVIEKGIYNNPTHSLEGLEEYSHVW